VGLQKGIMSNVVGLGLHTKGRAHTGGIGIGWETQNMKVSDVPTAEDLIQ
jgi:hypothetical protein